MEASFNSSRLQREGFFPQRLPRLCGCYDTQPDGYFDDSNCFDGQIDCVEVAQSSFTQAMIDAYTCGHEDDLVEWGSVEASSGSALLDLRYGYDDSGSVTWIHDGTNNETYTYDLVDRLTASSGPWGSIGITYDAVGNRLSKSVGASTVSYTYDVMDMIVSATGVSFTWDGNGNMLTWDDGADEWGYRYDQLNRLVGVDRDGAASANYTYDADGRRVHSWDSVEGTTLYAYAGLNVLDEISGGSHERHVYAGSMQVASSDAGVVEYYHVDHLGSTRLKTNSSGGVVYVSGYEPFGPGYGEDGVEDYRYTGKQEDPTGLYYYGARYYNSEIGRFITKDQATGDLTTPQSLNRYIYCMNNPQKYTDHNGKNPILASMGYGALLGAISNGLIYSAMNQELLHTNSQAFFKGLAKTVVVGAAAGAVSGFFAGAGYVAEVAGTAKYALKVVGNLYAAGTANAVDAVMTNYDGGLNEDKVKTITSKSAKTFGSASTVGILVQESINFVCKATGMSKTTSYIISSTVSTFAYKAVASSVYSNMFGRDPLLQTDPYVENDGAYISYGGYNNL